MVKEKMRSQPDILLEVGHADDDQISLRTDEESKDTTDVGQTIGDTSSKENVSKEDEHDSSLLAFI